MNDSELLSYIDTLESDAVIYNGKFTSTNEDLLNQYYSRPYGDEQEGRSQVVSTDIQDVVEADMTSLARVFLGHGDIVKFNPNTSREDDIQEAEEKTKYVNYLVKSRPDSFRTLFSCLKEAEIQQISVLKFYYEDARTTTEERFDDVDSLELQEIMQSLEGEDVSSIEIVDQYSRDEEGRFDVKFRVTRGEECIRIVNVPIENFLISSNAASEDDADLIGDVVIKARGDLIAEGFDEATVKMLPRYTSTASETSSIKNARFRDEGGVKSQPTVHWASEEVEVMDLSVKIDYDGDGIAERRRVIKSGNYILENEQFELVQYAVFCTVPMPNTVIGRSRGEMAQHIQRIKTVVMRQSLDNLYFVNNQRNIVSNDVELDDLLTVRPNGIVRTDGPVDQAIYPIATQYVGDKALQMIQYLDFTRAQSTGTLMASQGLNGEDLNKETATRFNGVQDEGSAKIELVARCLAEMGFRKLYEGIAWLVSRYQNTGKEVYILGKPLKVDPSKWKHKHHVVSQVGVGAGDADQVVEQMSGLLAVQNQLKQAGSELVDSKKLFNTLERIVKGLGLPTANEFFNDPEKPDELLMAQNEQLMQMVQMLQQQVQANPLAEAETIKAQARLMEVQQKEQLQTAKAVSDAQIQMAKMQEETRQFNEKLQAEITKQQQELAAKLTELELKYNQDVPGAVV